MDAQRNTILKNGKTKQTKQNKTKQKDVHFKQIKIKGKYVWEERKMNMDYREDTWRRVSIPGIYTENFKVKTLNKTLQEGSLVQSSVVSSTPL